MNLHEYQAKSLFRRHGIAVPEGVVASSADQALEEAGPWCAADCVVKAQIHAGGRGKAGGVRRISGTTELRDEVDAMLGTHLVTAQTDSVGQPVDKVLVEKPVDIARELYLSVVVDRSAEAITFVACAAGGMDIEEVARQHPESIHTVHVDLVTGLQPFQSRQLGFKLGLGGNLRELHQLMAAVYALFLDHDLSLVEINPLVVTADGALVALDAKINLDDSALYRQTELAAWRDPAQEDEREYRAHQHGLNYVPLSGTIGCMVNGAGLAMATMDIIKLHGGEPANFLDVGGGTSAEKVAEAFKIILQDAQVRAILVNIFGGIVRCDLIAEGIIRAVQEVHLGIPLVVRLQGTNMEQGKALLERSGLHITTTDDLTEAATKAVAAAQEGG